VPSVWGNEVWLCLHIGQNALDLKVYGTTMSHRLACWARIKSGPEYIPTTYSSLYYHKAQLYWAR